MTYSELENYIMDRAETDSAYAIAWALLKVADQLGDIGVEVREIATQLETDQ